MRRRGRCARPLCLPEPVSKGLRSLISGNEREIASMLDLPASPSKSEAKVSDEIYQGLVAVMSVNSLSAEGLLAQWFRQELLAAYAQRIGKSPKGNPATLAARIATAWSKPTFQPPVAAVSVEEGDAPPVAKRKRVSDSSSNDLPCGADAASQRQSISSAVTRQAPTAVDHSMTGDDHNDPNRSIDSTIRGIINYRLPKDGTSGLYKVRFNDRELPPKWVSQECVSAAQIDHFWDRKNKAKNAQK